MAETTASLLQAALLRHQERKGRGQWCRTGWRRPSWWEVTRRCRHPKYKADRHQAKKFYAHDEQGTAKIGDVVRISSAGR